MFLYLENKLKTDVIWITLKVWKKYWHFLIPPRKKNQIFKQKYAVYWK